jgi:hypothetical protein
MGTPSLRQLSTMLKMAAILGPACPESLKLGHGIEDLVGGFVPNKGFRVAVVFDEAVDGCFQFFGRALNAAAKLAFCEQSESAFHQVQP